MRLVIAEKPSVASAIAKVLGATKQNEGFLSGNGYAVSWCFGHLAELASPESYGEEYAKWQRETLPILPRDWQYTITTDKLKQFSTLKKLVNSDKITDVVNACDAGREGELIFRTVYRLTGCVKPIFRLWISSMEDSAIKKGFDELRPGEEYDNLYAAALCRSKADWLVGINATRLFSVLYHRTLNVGRVVSPTLAMIVEREAEISSFKSEPFYKVVLDFGDFKAESEKITDKAAADELLSKCQNAKATVIEFTESEKKEVSPTLYDLTTLQRAANRSLGFTSQQTLDYLQSLYEKKLCTYPRTDSKYLTDDMESFVPVLADISKRILGVSDVPSVNAKQVLNSKKVSDHHAIVFTKNMANAELGSLLMGEQSLIKLIATRTLAALANPYRYLEKTATIKCGDTEFTAKGRTVLDKGWTAYKESDKEYSTFSVSKGDDLTVKNADVSEGKTEPPKHYTEDTLLSAMENAGKKDMPKEAERKGIGTPATRAAIIEKLISAGFVERHKNKKVTNLMPVGVGKSLVTVLPEQLQSPLLTAEWEQKLLQVEKGEMNSDDFLSEIFDMVSALIRDYTVIDGADVLFPSGRKVIGKCPRCGGNVAISSKGYFCEKDSCHFGIWKDNRYLSKLKINLSDKLFEALLKEGHAYVSGIYSEKTGKRFDAYLCMTDDGTRTSFSLDFNK